MVKEMKLVVNQPPNQAFSQGAEVSGTLVVELDKPKSYNSIQVTLEGKAHVRWTETETTTTGNRRTTRTIVYTQTEIYVDVAVVVWEKAQAPGGTLQPGVYNFPFRFVLPSPLPSSFEGRWGHIRYQLEGRISTGLLKFDRVVTQGIPVAEVVDAANNPSCLTPLQYENDKTVCCLCCASGPVTTRAQIQRSGFCIGESIPFTVEIENGSSRRVKLSASLYQQVTFFARGRRRTSSGQIVGIASDRIQAHTTITWNPGDSLKIPVTHTTLTAPSCNIIEIIYILYVKTHISGSLTLTMEIPVVIGNVPHRAAGNQRTAPVPPPAPLPPAPLPSAPLPSAPVISQLPPPGAVGVLGHFPPDHDSDSEGDDKQPLLSSYEQT